MKYRKERLSSLIKTELSKIINKEIQIEGALLTVTQAEVQERLETVEISVSVYPSAKLKEAMEILEKRRPWLRHLLGEKIKIRNLPQIIFKPADY